MAISASDVSRRPAPEQGPYARILAQTDEHRRSHRCWAYPFQEGPALGVLAAATGARRILELGTALGYTACCLADGAVHARVDTIERDPIHATLARDNTEAEGFGERVHVIEGEFDRVLPTLEPGYDLAFIDGYAPTLEQLKAVRRLLRPRGVLVTANLDLDSGRAVRSALWQPSEWKTAAMLEAGGSTVSVSLQGEAP